jgi:predicted nucleic acid-binding protein
MITAIDTDVFLDILVPDPQFFKPSLTALEAAARAGSLGICDFVYAELRVHFPRQSECDELLRENDIRMEGLSRPASFLASRLWKYHRQKGGAKTRILTDFLVGAHAQLQASQLFTRDRGFYREMFRSLPLIDPANPRRT